jgi:hypothetical protein
MNLRRVSVALAVTGGLLLSFTGVAGAGLQTPRDMTATPSTGPIGQVVVIANAANSPCGGQQGDGPAQVSLTVTKPDTQSEVTVVVLADSSGNWSYSYTTTDQLGTYTVEGTCTDVPNVPAQVSATDFDYTDATFDIVAPATTTTEPSTTTTVAPAVAAVAAQTTPAFTG